MNLTALALIIGPLGAFAVLSVVGLVHPGPMARWRWLLILALCAAGIAGSVVLEVVAPLTATRPDPGEMVLIFGGLLLVVPAAIERLIVIGQLRLAGDRTRQLHVLASRSYVTGGIVLMLGWAILTA